MDYFETETIVLLGRSFLDFAAGQFGLAGCSFREKQASKQASEGSFSMGVFRVSSSKQIIPAVSLEPLLGFSFSLVVFPK
jgi:hypothetical protein